MGQYPGCGLAQIAQHGFEQIEGLRFIFIQRVALSIGPQDNAAAQMIQGQKMIFPGLIEQLQQQTLFHHAHDIGAIVSRFFRHPPIGGVADAFLYFLVRDAFLGTPIHDGQIQAKGLHRIRRQALGIPLFRIGPFRDMFGDHAFGDLAAHVRDGFRNVFGIHQFQALFVNHLALVVHDIVVFQQVLAQIKVSRLDLFLGFF